MTAVTIEEAQARLPELIDQLAAGEPVVILRDDRPVAELTKRPAEETVVDLATAGPRSGFGCCKGQIIYIADDFDAPLEDFKDDME